jgi:hypothetical protein
MNVTATHTTATADGAMSSTEKPFVAGTYALSREFCHYLIGVGLVAAEHSAGGTQ